MIQTRPQLIKPGVFGSIVAADARRGVYDAHNESMLAKDSPVDVVFIGDSITEMWALDAYFCGTRGLLVNRGIGGDITRYVRKRFEADALQLRPGLIVLAIGVNNLWDLDAWEAPLRRTPQAIEEEIVSDISAMVKNALTHDIPIVLCSILPTNILFNMNSLIRNQTIKQVNERLRHLAHELQGAVFVDYHSHFVADDGLTLRDGISDDGLHPHALGYEIMANVLLDTLKEANIATLEMC